MYPSEMATNYLTTRVRRFQYAPRPGRRGIRTLIHTLSKKYSEEEIGANNYRRVGGSAQSPVKDGHHDETPDHPLRTYILVIYGVEGRKEG